MLPTTRPQPQTPNWQACGGAREFAACLFLESAVAHRRHSDRYGLRRSLSNHALGSINLLHRNGCWSISPRCAHCDGSSHLHCHVPTISLQNPWIHRLFLHPSPCLRRLAHDLCADDQSWIPNFVPQVSSQLTLNAGESRLMLFLQSERWEKEIRLSSIR